MTLRILLVSAAALAMSAPVAFAQDAPVNPGQPTPATQAPTPMPPPPTTPPVNDPSMSQSAPDASGSSPTASSTSSGSAKPHYGHGWSAKKCDDARKTGKDVDPANCPAPQPK